MPATLACMSQGCQTPTAQTSCHHLMGHGRSCSAPCCLSRLVSFSAYLCAGVDRYALEGPKFSGIVLCSDGFLRIFAGRFTLSVRGRGFGLLKYAGRPSNILGTAPGLSFSFSRCSDTDSPLTTNSSVRIISVGSKCFSQTRTCLESKLNPPLSCRGIARFHISRCSASLGRQNSEAFSCVPL